MLSPQVQLCHCLHLQYDWKLFGRLAITRAVLQPKLKGSQLLRKEWAGLELHLPLVGQQAAHAKLNEP